MRSNGCPNQPRPERAGQTHLGLGRHPLRADPGGNHLRHELQAHARTRLETGLPARAPRHGCLRSRAVPRLQAPRLAITGSEHQGNRRGTPCWPRPGSAFAAAGTVVTEINNPTNAPDLAEVAPRYQLRRRGSRPSRTRRQAANRSWSSVVLRSASILDKAEKPLVPGGEDRSRHSGQNPSTSALRAALA